MTLRPVPSGPLGLLLALALIPATGHATGLPDASSTSAYRGRRVLLVTPEPGGDIAPAVLTRLRGELRAARFEMDAATIAADAPRRATVEEMATREGTSAALGIFFGSGRVEMWASDASAGRTLMQNLPLDQGTADRRATIVAVKAVDLLKATLAEIWSAPPPPVSEPLMREPVIVAPPPPPPAVVIQIQSSCEHFGLRDGSNGADGLEAYTSDKVAAIDRTFNDCGGGWQIYWRRNIPGLNNPAKTVDGAPMRNWWPMLFY